jgi:hypothetical protein
MLVGYWDCCGQDDQIRPWGHLSFFLGFPRIYSRHLRKKTSLFLRLSFFQRSGFPAL